MIYSYEYLELLFSSDYQMHPWFVLFCICLSRAWLELSLLLNRNIMELITIIKTQSGWDMNCIYLRKRYTSLAWEINIRVKFYTCRRCLQLIVGKNKTRNSMPSNTTCSSSRRFGHDVNLEPMEHLRHLYIM